MGVVVDTNKKDRRKENFENNVKKRNERKEEMNVKKSKEECMLKEGRMT